MSLLYEHCSSLFHPYILGTGIQLMNKLLASYVSKVCVAGTTISRHKAVPATQVRYTKNTLVKVVLRGQLLSEGRESETTSQSEASLWMGRILLTNYLGQYSIEGSLSLYIAYPLTNTVARLWDIFVNIYYILLLEVTVEY